MNDYAIVRRRQPIVGLPSMFICRACNAGLLPAKHNLIVLAKGLKLKQAQNLLKVWA